MLSVRDPNIPIKSSKNVENLECGICCQLFYNAISISPCLHTFCAGCISHWYLTNPTCPICRLQCMDLIENREKREMVKEAIIDFPEKTHDEECKKQLDQYEKEYLEKYLIHWTPAKLCLVQRTSTLLRDNMLNPIFSNQVNPTYQRRLERLHELRIKANGNTNLIPTGQYIELKRRQIEISQELYLRHMRAGNQNTMHQLGPSRPANGNGPPAPVPVAPIVQQVQRPTPVPTERPAASSQQSTSTPRPPQTDQTTRMMRATSPVRAAQPERLAQPARGDRTTRGGRTARGSRTARAAQPAMTAQPEAAQDSNTQNDQQPVLRRSRRIAARQAL